MIQEGIVKHGISRLLGLIPTLLMLITIAFFLIRVAPGGPFDSEKPLPPAWPTHIWSGEHPPVVVEEGTPVEKDTHEHPHIAKVLPASIIRNCCDRRQVLRGSGKIAF